MTLNGLAQLLGTTAIGVLVLTTTVSIPAQERQGVVAKVNAADCAGFATQDAAAWLKIPAEQVSRRVEKVGGSLWICPYSAGGSPPGISFSLEVSPSAAKAAEQMERYREHLVTAGDTGPFKGKLPKGADSDIMGVGDEAVWSDVNGSLTVRRGNVTLQVTLPKVKADQIKLAQAVLAKV